MVSTCLPCPLGQLQLLTHPFWGGMITCMAHLTLLLPELVFGGRCCFIVSLHPFMSSPQCCSLLPCRHHDAELVAAAVAAAAAACQAPEYYDEIQAQMKVTRDRLA